MIDVSRKNEKFMVNRNKLNPNKANNESRGESPARKGSFPVKNQSSLSNQVNGNNGGSMPATPGSTNCKKLQQLSRNASVIPLNNTTINININDINANNALRKLERSSSCMKNNLQQMVSQNRLSFVIKNKF